MQELVLYVCKELRHLTLLYYQEYKMIMCAGPYQRNLDNSKLFFTLSTLTA